MIVNSVIGTVQAAQLTESASVRQVTPAEATQSFGSYLRQAIDEVSAQEKAVHNVTERFIVGQADVSEVMIVSEQAHLALQLTTQVRNKVIDAYQEIMRMQL
ncbi:flagellar hook-basal body complex protein FliE [Paenibacillus tarimensis]